LDDVIVSLDSWEYHVEFMVLQPKISSGGHSLILGRPWLATANAFIGCRFENMLISHDDSVKNVTYPPAKPSHEPKNTLWLDNANSDEENSQPIFSID
jgi:hypothetical protein